MMADTDTEDQSQLALLKNKVLVIGWKNCAIPESKSREQGPLGLPVFLYLRQQMEAPCSETLLKSKQVPIK